MLCLVNHSWWRYVHSIQKWAKIFQPHSSHYDFISFKEEVVNSCKILKSQVIRDIYRLLIVSIFGQRINYFVDSELCVIFSFNYSTENMLKIFIANCYLFRESYSFNFFLPNINRWNDEKFHSFDSVQNKISDKFP